MNRRGAIEATVALGLFPTRLLGDARSIARPEVLVGDRWTYNRVDYWTKNVDFVYELDVTFASDKAIITTIRFSNDQRQLSGYRVSGVQVPDATWTADWNAISDVEGRVISPHTGWFEFPLSIGARRHVRYFIEAQRPNSFVIEEDRDVHVVGWEDVTVPAGRFNAIKIIAEGNVRNPAFGISGPARNVIWYAPAVKRWVKMQYESIDYKNPQATFNSLGRIYYRDTDELIGYQLARDR